jgi:hypothetical protein
MVAHGFQSAGHPILAQSGPSGTLQPGVHLLQRECDQISAGAAGDDARRIDHLARLRTANIGSAAAAAAPDLDELIRHIRATGAGWTDHEQFTSSTRSASTASTTPGSITCKSASTT